MSVMGVTNNRHLAYLPNRLFQAQIKENIEVPHHWPLWDEFTVDRWIPLKSVVTPVVETLFYWRESYPAYSMVTIGILTKAFCTSDPNLIILSWTGDELWWTGLGLTRTHVHRHRQTFATTIPGVPNWPGVKTAFHFSPYTILNILLHPLLHPTPTPTFIPNHIHTHMRTTKRVHD